MQRASQAGAQQHVLLLAFLAKTALRMGGQAAADKMPAVLSMAGDLVREAQTMLPCCLGEYYVMIQWGRQTLGVGCFQGLEAEGALSPAVVQCSTLCIGNIMKCTGRPLLDLDSSAMKYRSLSGCIVPVGSYRPPWIVWGLAEARQWPRRATAAAGLYSPTVGCKLG